MENETELRVIIFREGNSFIAQCLEHDISAFASDMKTLKKRFMGVLAAEWNISLERNGEPLAGIDPAPKQFHDMWKKPKRPKKVNFAKSNTVIMAEAA